MPQIHLVVTRGSYDALQVAIGVETVLASTIRAKQPGAVRGGWTASRRPRRSSMDFTSPRPKIKLLRSEGIDWVTLNLGNSGHPGEQLFHEVAVTAPKKMGGVQIGLGAVNAVAPSR